MVRFRGLVRLRVLIYVVYHYSRAKRASGGVEVIGNQRAKIRISSQSRGLGF